MSGPAGRAAGEALPPLDGSEALFVVDGDVLRPTAFARGPWAPNALHGGPVAAALARAIESVEAPLPMHPARLTVELLRPVPLSPLRIETTLLRPGKKVQLVGASLFADALEVARGTALRIRRADLRLPEGAVMSDLAPPPTPHGVAPIETGFHTWSPAFHNAATEHRVVCGSWSTPGPCTDWIRLRVPLVAGESPSPLQRVAAAADFGNGVSGALPFGAFRYVNPDLSIHLFREPEGEWIALDGVTHLTPSGVAMAESALFDERGRIGRSLQSLILERG